MQKNPEVDLPVNILVYLKFQSKIQFSETSSSHVHLQNIKHYSLMFFGLQNIKIKKMVISDLECKLMSTNHSPILFCWKNVIQNVIYCVLYISALDFYCARKLTG